ncbi:helix-turn-helix transcriptional regulator [Lentzea sp. NEAU-D13]|uniref:Helix-turn-helix transcriptional regulator n=1 Tax=Lentzea alba TaxID=2714351 RepID=A0A7C9RRP2_9PSEU|nr:helix-turn-helix transcriptional regulator [Lentzea alba]NGY61250.1 helix-turn-helix transcriptional regulator [Lentzea alba]
MSPRRDMFVEACKRTGYTIDSLAAALGVDRSTVSRWRRGQTPQAAQRLKLAEALRLSLPELDELLEQTAPPTSTALSIIWPMRSPAEGDLLARLDQTRLLVDQTLSKGLGSVTRLELIEERIGDRIDSYTHTPPAEVLDELMPDLLEVQQLADERQPARVQERLSTATAVLGLLSADALMKLGEIDRARYWYGTARLAADDTTNGRLRAQVRAQETMLPYYYGRLQRTVSLAQEAQALAADTVCGASALAAAAEGRALARLGDVEGAERAMATAQRLVDRLDEPTTDAAFEFNDKRLLLYLSGTLTYLGEFDRARHVQQEALERYRSDPTLVIDPALIKLDQAVGEAIDGDIDDACTLAVGTLLDLPADHRTRIVLKRATDVVQAIPTQRWERPAVSELRELVAPKSGT